MQAHDYIDAGGYCAECQRGPGDYLHIGLSDTDIEARGGSRSLSEYARYELTDTPMALRQAEMVHA